MPARSAADEWRRNGGALTEDYSLGSRFKSARFGSTSSFHNQLNYKITIMLASAARPGDVGECGGVTGACATAFPGPALTLVDSVSRSVSFYHSLVRSEKESLKEQSGPQEHR